MTGGDKTSGDAAGDQDQRMSTLMISVLNHPLRRELLKALNGSDDAHSTIQLSKVTGANVRSVDYHIKILVSGNLASGRFSSAGALADAPAEAREAP